MPPPSGHNFSLSTKPERPSVHYGYDREVSLSRPAAYVHHYEVTVIGVRVARVLPYPQQSLLILRKETCWASFLLHDIPLVDGVTYIFTSVLVHQVLVEYGVS